MTPPAPLIPDWELFERDYVSSGLPQLFVVRPNPLVAIFLDDGGSRIGLRFRRPADAQTSRTKSLQEIHVAEVVIDTSRLLEVWTDARALYPNFYRLATEVVSEVIEGGSEPGIALDAAIARWEMLLSRPALLSEERQTGLFGELWLLERLVGSQGGAAVEAWIGPTGQSHDFRLGTFEFEVKTTAGAMRLHTINGTGQLEPSVDCTLHLLSLRIADGGTGGRTLSEAIEGVAAALAPWPDGVNRYRALVASAGYRNDDAQFYPRRRRLRDSPVLIPVIDGMPRLTRDALSAIDQRFSPGRLGRIVYDIDVTGLGFADGTQEFLAVVPASRDTES